MVKITPYSQIVNTVLFISFALITTAFTTLIMQALFILFTSFIFKMRLKIRLYHLIALLPVLLFIFILNSLHGGGEIIFRAGPFLFMKQGIVRGAFYTLFILELFMMSRALTGGFAPEKLFAVFYTIDRLLSRRGRRIGGSSVKDKGGFMMILYHIIRLFYNTYSELRLFFTLRSQPLKQRVIFFMKRVFLQSIADCEGRDKLVVDFILPNKLDFLHVVLQLLALFSSLLIQRMWV